jgi:hypothetical protein
MALPETCFKLLNWSLGSCAKEDKTGWSAFLEHFKSRGLLREIRRRTRAAFPDGQSALEKI